SGDGDFVPLVQHLQKALGTRVEVMAFGKSASAKLIEAADSFSDLDANQKRYLFERRSHASKPAKDQSANAVRVQHG
ncbi:NYN domain-containing protein, partial [Candidatus Woesearchaeota archaeon]|nr:NYN domain-containing protein [Candidatus Woesearchaeota archaeon]